MNDQQPLTSEEVIGLFTSMPTGQLVLLGLFIGTWIIGGNLLVAFHYKRRGKHWLSGLKPFAFPFKDFNVFEWLALAILALISLSFGLASFNYAN